MEKKKKIIKDQSMVTLYKRLKNDDQQVTEEGIYLGDDMYLLSSGEII
jgi:hypothetical protein